MRDRYPPKGYIAGRFRATTDIGIIRIRTVAASAARGTAKVFVDLTEFRGSAPSRFVGTWALVLRSSVWQPHAPHF